MVALLLWRRKGRNSPRGPARGGRPSCKKLWNENGADGNGRSGGPRSRNSSVEKSRHLQP